ncbi:hypothetical protein [Endozoicomonas sp. SESOKO2]|uniref:hypothetical protein n=1 Tax=Endozoicomonas sp. SESOKO2 TaxID=2828743 RepID=UPI002148DC46|nr:hypothetical protein [Endozoicomonas sp. SESOKO2]
MPIMTSSLPTLIQPPSVINELNFDAAMKAFNRFQELEEKELEMLELYRHQMTPTQFATVLKKMSDRVDVATQLEWQKACEDKRAIRSG